ncbi:hypothetical protein K469DRAFT_707090 [Zopfia rhizophila CBS 207.26]|uniref:Uncharacterized protein n=1 Tax=Zopfia rhizophila CBS 207.26 TaxID=1314779 RepID=A0A6A6D590_9PEZI|nr:hypothetical protein K469DRAFT_707090 [Zopfia rhizophila CBS 207.26]
MPPTRSVTGRVTLSGKVPPNGISVMPYSPYVTTSIPCIMCRTKTHNTMACEACRRANERGDLERLDRDVTTLQERIRQAEHEHMKCLDVLEEVSRKAAEARARVKELREQKELVERRRAVAIERAKQNLERLEGEDRRVGLLQTPGAEMAKCHCRIARERSAFLVG